MRPFRRGGLLAGGMPVALLHVGGLRSAAAGSIFLAVDRPDMRRIAVEIGPPDPELLAVGIDPFPQRFGRNPALRAVRAIGADDIGGKSVAITAARTAAVVRAIACRL